MFGPPGHLYVYFTYGMHFCANLTCLPEGIGSGVLLRAGEVISGIGVALARRTRARAVRSPNATSPAGPPAWPWRWPREGAERARCLRARSGLVRRANRPTAGSIMSGPRTGHLVGPGDALALLDRRRSHRLAVPAACPAPPVGTSACTRWSPRPREGFRVAERGL